MSRIWHWVLLLTGIYLAVGVINFLYGIVKLGTPANLTQLIAWPSNFVIGK